MNRAVKALFPAAKPDVKKTTIAGATLGIAMVLTPAISEIANAEILEYQIRRLIRFDSSCEILTLKRELNEDGGFTYNGICDNTTFYPDGIIVVCSDTEDERTCKIKTKGRKFDLLEAMRSSSPAPEQRADDDKASK